MHQYDPYMERAAAVCALAHIAQESDINKEIAP
jgi:hypothetical protein